MRKKTVIPALGEAHAQRAIGGNPKPIGGERKVQLIMFTYLYVKIYLVKLQINYGIGKKIGTP